MVKYGIFPLLLTVIFNAGHGREDSSVLIPDEREEII